MGDVSKSEDTSFDEEVEGVLGGETIKEKLLILVTKVGARPKMEVTMYEGNLNVD
jgi:hypothetical protein